VGHGCVRVKDLVESTEVATSPCYWWDVCEKRIPYALALQQTLPAAFAKLQPRFGTPWVAIVVNSTVVATLIPFSFQELIELDMFLYALALILEFAALFAFGYLGLVLGSGRGGEIRVDALDGFFCGLRMGSVIDDNVSSFFSQPQCNRLANSLAAASH